MVYGKPRPRSSGVSDQTSSHDALLAKRFGGNQIEMGEAVQISGATDRESQIRLTLDRLKAEKLKQAQQEAQIYLEEAKRNIQEKLSLAQKEADEIVAQAQANYDSVLEEARQKGYQAGYDAGYSDGRTAAEEDTQAMLLSANVLLVRAYEAQNAVLKEMASKATLIMKTIVERVVHHQLNQMTLEQWETWYKEVLTQLDASSRYRLVVGMDSYHRLQQFSKSLADLVNPDSTSPGFERIRLELDPHLATHEIYIISDEGMVDVSPSTQIDQYMGAITSDFLGMDSLTSMDVNPEDEEEQLSMLSEQLDAVLNPAHALPSEETLDALAEDSSSEATLLDSSLSDQLNAIVPEDSSSNLFDD